MEARDRFLDPHQGGPGIRPGVPGARRAVRSLSRRHTECRPPGDRCKFRLRFEAERKFEANGSRRVKVGARFTLPLSDPATPVSPSSVSSPGHRGQLTLLMEVE